MKKRYYWLKLKENFFENKKIKILSSLPDGKDMVLIYLKIQLKSLVTDGYITYEGIMNSICDEIALLIDEDTKLVEKSIQYLNKLGLIKITDDGIFMEAMQENVGSETDVAKRVRKYRQNKDEQETLQCNTEIEKEIELEKDLNIDIDKEKENIYQQIADMFNNTCVSFPKVIRISDNRKKAIKARLNNYSFDEIKSAFIKAESSDFLKGKNQRNWIANFDWIIKDCNIAKVLDGNYDNQTKAENKYHENKNVISNCSFDLSDLEKLINN